MKPRNREIALIFVLLLGSGRVLGQVVVPPPAADKLHVDPETTVPAVPEPRSPAAETGLPNFSRVNPNLFRGGQPSRAGIARLKQLGVRTILNLRQPDRFSRAEEDQARAAGIRYISVPMRNFLRPSRDSIAAVLKLLDDPVNQPVYVHCLHGSDRTGTVIACYRISHETWTAQKAIAEALTFGMSRFEYLKRSFIRQFSRSQPAPALVAAPFMEGRRPAPENAAGAAPGPDAQSPAAVPAGNAVQAGAH